MFLHELILQKPRKGVQKNPNEFPLFQEGMFLYQALRGIQLVHWFGQRVQDYQTHICKLFIFIVSTLQHIISYKFLLKFILHAKYK